MTSLEALDQLKQQIYFANKQKGFWELEILLDQTKGDLTLPTWYVRMKKAEKIALMHSELSEALEGIRKDKQDDHCPEFTSEEVELADAMIRIFDYAGGFNLRLAEAIFAKLEYNATRPHKHGKAF